MNFSVTFTEKPGYLHAVVSGSNSRENVMQYLEAIRSECLDRGIARVLIEERLDGPRLGTLDVFEIASGCGAEARDQFQAIAYVDVHAGELMPFAETVAVNRGTPVRVFRSVADAEAWLLGTDGADTGRSASSDAG